MVTYVWVGMLEIVGERCAVWVMRRNLVGGLRLVLDGVQCLMRAWVGSWVNVGVMRPSIYAGMESEGNFMMICARLIMVPRVRCGSIYCIFYYITEKG